MSHRRTSLLRLPKDVLREIGEMKRQGELMQVGLFSSGALGACLW